MFVLYQQSSSTDFAKLETLFFYPHHCLAIAEHHQCLIPAQPIIIINNSNTTTTKIIKSIRKKKDPSDSFQARLSTHAAHRMDKSYLYL